MEGDGAEPGDGQPDGDDFDRDRLLSGRTRRRAPHLLFLVESWSDQSDDDVFALLESTEAFAGLSREQLGDVLPLLEPRHVAAGEVVLTEGLPGAGMFIVGYGRLQVTRQVDGRDRVIAEVGPGDTVGERALVTGDAPAASVHAVRDSLLLCLDPGGLRRVAERHPDVVLRLARRLLRQGASPAGTASQRSNGVTAIAVVPAGEAPLPPGFVDDLAAALSAYGHTLRVSSSTVDADLGEGTAQLPLQDARNGRVVEWLQRTERANGAVLYEADASPTNWTRRCLRQADRVVRVADAGARVRPSSFEAELLDGPAPETVARQEWS